MAGAEQHAVCKDLPVDCKEREIRKIILVDYCYQSFAEVCRPESNILVNFFDLRQCRVRGAVRPYKPVAAEVAVTRRPDRTVITSVGLVIFAILVCLKHPLVNPVPDESALKNAVFLNDIPVVLEVSGAVPH